MSAVERVRKEYEQRLREAEREDALRKVAPMAERIYVLDRPLYGAVAWITYGGDEYGKTPATWEQALEAAKRHPAIAAKMVKNSSLSIQPERHPEKDGAESVSSMAPVWIDIETNTDTSLELHWYTETPEGIARIGVKLGSLYRQKNIANQILRWDDRPGQRVVCEQKLFIGPEMHSILREDGRAIAGFERPIKWASGGPQYPSRYTLYFVHFDADPNEAEVAVEMIAYMKRLSTKGEA